VPCLTCYCFPSFAGLCAIPHTRISNHSMSNLAATSSAVSLRSEQRPSQHCVAHFPLHLHWPQAVATSAI
jgi:hypothetical protein